MSQLSYINPKLLKWAREQCGFSYEDAAKNYLTPEKLEKAESGVVKLTFNQFLNLAKRYGRTPAFFYLEERPKIELIKDFRTLESTSVKYSPKLRKEIIKIKKKRDLSTEFQGYDKKYDYSFIQLFNLSDNPEEIAERIILLLKSSRAQKRRWKDPYSALKGWKEAIEEKGVLVFQISKIDVNEMRAFSISEIPYPTIALNRSDTPLGRIFSLIHEFCHIILKKGGLCRFSNDDEAHFEIEKFCNFIAGAVLVPKDDLLKKKIVTLHGNSKKWDERELEQLKKEFWVSKEVILRRLLILKLTSYNFYREMKRHWSKLPIPRGGGPEKIHQKILRTNSPNFIKIVLNAMNDNQITMVDVSNYLGMSLKHFDALRRSLQ